MKKCPFCAEEIKDETIICPFCERDATAIINTPQKQKNTIGKTKPISGRKRRVSIKVPKLQLGQILVLVVLIVTMIIVWTIGINL